MLYALLAAQILTLLALVVLLLRMHSTAAETKSEDPRLAQLLAADLGTRMTVLDTRSQTLDQHLRDQVAQLRAETAASSASLRNEVLGNVTKLGDTLRISLEAFRNDNTAAAERLRSGTEAQMNMLAQRFSAFTSETNSLSRDSREALHRSLTELGSEQAAHQEKLRSAIEDRLNALNVSNAAKLEEMRQTVDEKLHATLQNRLTESFGQVTDQLTKVHAGLGEMTKLSAGVDDLSRIFTNVKSRGGFAEIQLGKLLDQVLAPGQYVQNANVRPGTQEVVEYAVRFPGTGGDVLLAIDAKFPREDWERLESAYETSDLARIEAARKSFDAAIRTEGKRICSKYINEPITTPYAIMFLPTESLYAEVLRRDGLQAELHQTCRVMVAGPTNLYALLTSFQLGFKMLNLQKKGDEVWNVLASAQTEFGKFGGLMDKMDKQVGTVQNTIRDLGTRTRAINRTLRDVSVDTTAPASSLGASNSFDGFLPMLAANEDE
jgi:DNA recombination protein RmuC